MFRESYTLLKVVVVDGERADVGGIRSLWAERWNITQTTKGEVAVVIFWSTSRYASGWSNSWKSSFHFGLHVALQYCRMAVCRLTDSVYLKLQKSLLVF